jgi:hypothetical protein
MKGWINHLCPGINFTQAHGFLPMFFPKLNPVSRLIIWLFAAEGQMIL